MPCIDGVLQHRETIFLQAFPEKGKVSAVFFCVGWQIVKYKYPQNSVLVKPEIIFTGHCGDIWFSS